MKRKHIITIIFLALLGFLLYNSFEFRNLEQKRAEDQAKTFKPADYARNFWDNRLFGILDTSVNAQELIELFNTDMDSAIKKGKTLGDSRVHSYLLRGEGKIVSTNRDGVEVSIKNPPSNPEILICTKSYISGNAVRDASGLVDVSKFSDTMKFNRISSEINKIVVQEVIKPFLDNELQAGMTIKFAGATEVAEDATEELRFGDVKEENENGIKFHLLKVIPIELAPLEIPQNGNSLQSRRLLTGLALKQRRENFSLKHGYVER